MASRPRRGRQEWKFLPERWADDLARRLPRGATFPWYVGPDWKKSILGFPSALLHEGKEEGPFP